MTDEQWQMYAYALLVASPMIGLTGSPKLGALVMRVAFLVALVGANERRRARA